MLNELSVFNLNVGLLRNPCRRTVEVMCCPECGSLRVRMNDNGYGVAMFRWECTACSHAWKEHNSLTTQRAYSVVVSDIH